jgi:hypothetical protein
LSDSAAHVEGARIAGNPDATGYYQNDTLQFRTCDVWCELVLSFRSIATVAVYFYPRARREEVYDLLRILRLLRPRRKHRYARLYEGDAVDIVPTTSGGSHVDDGGGLEVWQIHERDVRLEKRLAEGSFGVVWEGQWGRNNTVAIKVLRAPAVDDEGCIVDPMVVGALIFVSAFAARTLSIQLVDTDCPSGTHTHQEEDFRKECATLQRLQHPHLLKFHGYGTTSIGNGFIVTELMVLGSLRGVLHDEAHVLPWRTRISIALMLALGMEHLHAIPLIHRVVYMFRSLFILVMHHVNDPHSDV